MEYVVVPQSYLDHTPDGPSVQPSWQIFQPDWISKAFSKTKNANLIGVHVIMYDGIKSRFVSSFCTEKWTYTFRKQNSLCNDYYPLRRIPRECVGSVLYPINLLALWLAWWMECISYIAPAINPSIVTANCDCNGIGIVCTSVCFLSSVHCYCSDMYRYGSCVHFVLVCMCITVCFYYTVIQKIPPKWYFLLLVLYDFLVLL